MLPNATPPQDVVDLVNEYKANPTTRELVIYDNLFILYELEIIEAENDQNPAATRLGKSLGRAYWRDAAGISPEMIKSRLGIR